jgi:hypothetical protein
MVGQPPLVQRGDRGTVLSALPFKSIDVSEMGLFSFDVGWTLGLVLGFGVWGLGLGVGGQMFWGHASVSMAS